MLIKNARTVSGETIDLLTREGVIAAIGLELTAPEGEEVIDAAGRTLLPSFIDLHCHWRTPNAFQKRIIYVTDVLRSGIVPVRCCA